METVLENVSLAHESIKQELMNMWAAGYNPLMEFINNHPALFNEYVGFVVLFIVCTWGDLIKTKTSLYKTNEDGLKIMKPYDEDEI